jgi:hypothetical protein
LLCSFASSLMALWFSRLCILFSFVYHFLPVQNFRFLPSIHLHFHSGMFFLNIILIKVDSLQFLSTNN